MIALMAKKTDQLGQKAIIISSDSDFHQLVTPNVSIYSTMAKKNRYVTYENFSTIHEGLEPEQFLDFKALQGDGSDDVPGVKGIGPATARQLLLNNKSVEEWKETTAKTTAISKIQQKIIDQWDQFQLSKAMIDLHNPLADFATAKIIRCDPDWPAVRTTAIEYEIADIYTNFAAWIKPFKQLK